MSLKKQKKIDKKKEDERRAKNKEFQYKITQTNEKRGAMYSKVKQERNHFETEQKEKLQSLLTKDQ